MSDSYPGTPNGELTPAHNGMANGSNPSLANNNTGVSSVVRKKLMGYVGFANLPNQVHRKSVRKGFQFTAMVVGACIARTRFKVSAAKERCFYQSYPLAGESGLGKSTLINTLFNTKLYPTKEVPPPSADRPKTVAIESISAGKHIMCYGRSFSCSI